MFYPSRAEKSPKLLLFCHREADTRNYSSGLSLFRRGLRATSSLEIKHKCSK